MRKKHKIKTKSTIADIKKSEPKIVSKYTNKRNLEDFIRSYKCPQCGGTAKRIDGDLTNNFKIICFTCRKKLWERTVEIVEM